MEKEIFKTSKEFIGFVSNVSGTNVNLVNKVAFLNPHTIYGMMDKNVKLKFEINENEINVENVGSVEISNDRIQKIIDDICYSTVSNYTDKNIFSEFKFESEDGNLCYLQTTKLKPIDKLRNSVKSNINANENSLNKIKDILNKSKSKKEVSKKVIESDPKVKNNSKSYTKHLESQFNELSNEKIKELKQKIIEKENAILKVKNEIKFKQSEVDKIKSDLDLFKKRLFKLESENIEFNNYFFHIDEKSKDDEKDLNFSEETEKVIDKICESLNIKKDLLIKNVFTGFYKIYLTKDVELNVDIKEKTVDSEILDNILKLDLNGEFVIETGYIKYWGDLNWHQLNKGMENLGFKSNSEFSEKIKSIK